MAKDMVGFACSIRLPWMNKTVELIQQGLSKEQIKEEINTYLSFEIDSPVRLRKSREIMLHSWYYENEQLKQFREEGLKLIDAYPEYAAAIHMMLLAMAYPVFADVCSYMGRLFELNEVLPSGAVYKKLFEEWGERSTLETTVRRVSLTLKEFGLIENIERSSYRRLNIPIERPEVTMYLISAALVIKNASYFNESELEHIDVLFPFRYTVTKEELYNSNRFAIHNTGGEMAISLR